VVPLNPKNQTKDDSVTYHEVGIGSIPPREHVEESEYFVPSMRDLVKA